jgi:lipoprotein-anchoring transpeptidase ErfK/SrfK
VLPIVGREGDWLEVIATERPNNKTGWIRASHADVGENLFSVQVDLSARMIVVKNGERVVRRIKSAVGGNGTATPTGRFAVTDRFNFTDAGSVYGCCALALSAHQTDLAPGWAGDDRVAIHATPDKGSIGNAATNGCMRVPDKDAAWLMTRVPLGTVVTIRS